VDTVAAVATPAGEGALGILRVTGADARAAAAALTGREDFTPRHAHKVSVKDREGAIDEGVLVYYPAESSPTGEDLIELTLHGSPYILQRALSSALTRARAALPGEFTQRAYMNGKLDLSQAEAVFSLIHARTASSHRAALRGLSGGVSDAVRAVRAPLFELLVRIEATLDHPEEDIPGLRGEEIIAELEALRLPLSRLADTFSSARLGPEGPRLALLGAPNAGKSSLFNSLLGRRRAIVDAAPGTTRDTLEEPALLAGEASVLVDTAGLREDCADAAEREGAARARAALETCDAAVLVVDAARAPSAEEALLHERIVAEAGRRGTPLVCALNKSDLGRAWDGAALPGAVPVSARLGTGLDELRAALAAAVGGRPADDASLVVTSARQAAELDAAAAEIAAAEAAVRRHPGRWEDLAACSLREALRRLGLLLGEGADADALGAIFARFCVGK
jgi:tRNA modification GTPase